MSHSNRRQSGPGKTGLEDAQDAHKAQTTDHTPGTHHPDETHDERPHNHQNERSKSEHHSRNKGQLPFRSRSYDTSQRHQSESPHSQHSQHRGKEVEKLNNQEMEPADKNDICICGPNIYGRFLGPTVDEQILAGLTALFEMCNECPETYAPSDIDQDPSQHAELAKESESSESLDGITTEPHSLIRTPSSKSNMSPMRTPPAKESSMRIPVSKESTMRSKSKEESLRMVSPPKSLLKQESFQTASSEKTIKISEDIAPQKSLSSKKSAFSNVGSVNASSGTERPATRESSIITEPLSETSSSQTEAAAIEAKLKSLSNISKESKERLQECPCRVDTVSKCAPLLVCQSPSAMCDNEPSVESNVSESLRNHERTSYGPHSEQSQKLSSHSKSLSYSHQLPSPNSPLLYANHHEVHSSEHQVASHELQQSLSDQYQSHELSGNQNALPHLSHQSTFQDPYSTKHIHQSHYPETEPPCICSTCSPYEAAMQKQHQKPAHHESRHRLAPHPQTPQHQAPHYPTIHPQSPHRHNQMPQIPEPGHQMPHQPVTHDPISHHQPPHHSLSPYNSTNYHGHQNQHASSLKLHKPPSRNASKSPQQHSSQHRLSHTHSKQCQCPYCSPIHKDDSNHIKSDPSLSKKRSSSSHRDKFHPGINKYKLNSDECTCCKCNDTTDSSCNTIDSGSRQVNIKVHTKSQESSTSSCQDGSAATKESSTSYTCVLNCPRKKSERKSCASQFEDSDTTKHSSTSCACLAQCPKKSALRRQSASRKCSKTGVQKLNGMTNKVKICGCSTSTTSISEISEGAREELDGGDSAKAIIRYAITKITKFSSYTTFEVMKSTKNKPKTMPKKLEGVFVLRNRK